MRRSMLALAASLAFAAAAPGAAHAVAIAYEPFDYPPGSQAGPSGGSGFAAAWPATPALEIAGAGLSFGSLQTAGNALQLDATGTQTELDRTLTTTFGAPGDELWFSFLVRVDTQPATRTGVFMVLGDDVVTTAEGFAVGAAVIGAGYNFGITEFGGATQATGFDDDPVTLGQTAFLVGRVLFTAGNETIELFVNPTPGIAPTTPNDVLTALDFDVTSLGFRHGGNADAVIDELRLGTDYASVAPVPEPGVAALALLAGAAALVRRRPSWPGAQPSLGGRSSACGLLATSLRARLRRACG